MNTYYYQTDGKSGEIEAANVGEAYDEIRKTISDRMIRDGATLWVEPADESSGEERMTLGINAE